MRSKHFAALAGASMMVASPVVAAANPAQSLSVAKSVRAAAPADKGSKLGEGGGGIAALAIGAGVLAIVVIAFVNGEEDDSDSN